MRLTSEQVLTILGTASRLAGEDAVVYYANASRFLRYSREALGILPLHGDFSEEFTAIAGNLDLLI